MPFEKRCHRPPMSTGITCVPPCQSREGREWRRRSQFQQALLCLRRCRPQAALGPMCLCGCSHGRTECIRSTVRIGSDASAPFQSFFNFFSHGSQDLYPTYMTNSKGFTSYQATVATIIANCGAIFGGTITGYISQYLGRRLTIIGCCLWTACFIPLCYFSSSYASLCAGAFFLQAGVQGAWYDLCMDSALYLLISCHKQGSCSNLSFGNFAAGF